MRRTARGAALEASGRPSKSLADTLTATLRSARGTACAASTQTPAGPAIRFCAATGAPAAASAGGAGGRITAQRKMPMMTTITSRIVPATQRAVVSPALTFIACLLVAAAAGCEQASLPSRDGLRVPDVQFEPTPQHIVAGMLDLAQVGAADVVFDLGCGDGRIVIAAAKTRGARGVCVDIDPQRIRESRANAERSGVTDRIVFLNQDLLETGLGDATVVTLFLSPEMNLKVRPKLWRELKPGTRVVSYVHGMGDWAPREARSVAGPYGPRKLFLWVISLGNDSGSATGARPTGAS